MKKMLLFVFFTCTFCALQAQTSITYKSFGDGWVIPINSNTEVDIDEDGVVDFYINQYPDEIGFSPIFAVGCFSSPAEYAYTNFDARELMIFEAGDLVQINAVNLFDYIDDDRGSCYSTDGGFADGWVDQEEVYLGFAVIISSDNAGVRNGWLKAAVDATNYTLIIKEWAYTDIEGYKGGIVVGDTGQATNVQRLDDIAAVTIHPNPANDRVQVAFDYSGTENLSVIIQNSVGQELFSNTTTIPLGKNNLNISTSKWANGIYFVRFETPTSIRTERLSIAR